MNFARRVKITFLAKNGSKDKDQVISLYVHKCPLSIDILNRYSGLQWSISKEGRVRYLWGISFTKLRTMKRAQWQQ